MFQNIHTKFFQICNDQKWKINNDNDSSNHHHHHHNNNNNNNKEDKEGLALLLWPHFPLSRHGTQPLPHKTPVHLVVASWEDSENSFSHQPVLQRFGRGHAPLRHLVVIFVPNKKLYQHRPQIAKTHFCVINVKKKCPQHSTLQWHPAMAPSNVHRPLPQSWSSPSPQTIAHYNGTLQWHQVCSLPQSWSSWHPAMAPRTPPTLAVTLPSPHHSTLQWHPAMALSNGTTSTPPKLVVTLSPNHSTLQWHPTMAQQWHHVLCTLQWHPGATSNPPKWFVALPPFWK